MSPFYEMRERTAPPEEERQSNRVRNAAATEKNRYKERNGVQGHVRSEAADTKSAFMRGRDLQSVIRTR